MLMIVSFFHDTSRSNVNDRVTMCRVYSMTDQQAMLMIVSLFHDTSTSNVNDRVTIP